MSWFWLNFVDPLRPKDEQFLGMCMVKDDAPAGTPVEEVVKRVLGIARLFGINPDGAAVMYELRDGFTPYEKYAYKLFTDRDEVMKIAALPLEEIGTLNETKIH